MKCKLKLSFPMRLLQNEVNKSINGHREHENLLELNSENGKNKDGLFWART
jgi:hypothetical protein